MEKGRAYLFANRADEEPPERLYRSILGRIAESQVRTTRIKLAFFGTTALLSLFALVPTIRYVLDGFYRSGFYGYFSLLSSDSGAVFGYWKEFSLSLIESLPVSGLTLFLGVVFVLLISLKLMAQCRRATFLVV